MATWAIPDSTAVLEEFTPQEKAVLEAIQSATTPLASILGRAADRMRGACASGGYEVDATSGTIPPGFYSDVIAIARWNWLTALPAAAQSLRTDARKDAAEKAEKRLERVSMRELAVESPTTGYYASYGNWRNTQNRFATTIETTLTV